MASLIGQTLLGQFRVDSFIGSGGMGVVYRVWDLKRNVPLAMKVLHAELAEDPSAFKRFRREARALEKLAHPHIVPFYGLHQDGSQAFLLERYIDGSSLKQLLMEWRNRPMRPAEALIYLKAVSSALGYAHAHGVIHCDIKPGNVMVDRGGGIFLTDFGVARHAESTTTTLGLAGTAAYMSPEQCRGDSVTAETDIYALGIMLYEMLVGERPFRGDEKGTESGGGTAGERVRFAHVHLDPPNPRQRNPHLGDSLATAVLKALAKDPSRRFRSTLEFYQAVSSAAGIHAERVGDRVSLPGSVVAAYSPSPQGVQRAEVGTVAQRWLPEFRRAYAGLGRGRRVILVGLAGLALLSGFLFLIDGGGLAGDPASNERNALAVQSSGPSTTRANSAQADAPTSTPDRHATDSAATVVANQTQAAQATPTSLHGSLWRPFPHCGESRIRVGEWTRVSLYPPDANRVRDEPSMQTGQIVGHAKPGTVLQVLGGPECEGRMIWWWVRTQDGSLEGWTSEGEIGEFWLDPGSPNPP